MFLAVETEDVRPVAVYAGKGTDAARREELILVKHVAQDAHGLFARRDGQQPVAAALAFLQQAAVGDKLAQVGPVFEKPVHPLLEAALPLDEFVVNHLHSQQRDQPDERPDFDRDNAPVNPELVLVKPVFFIP